MRDFQSQRALSWRKTEPGYRGGLPPEFGSPCRLYTRSVWKLSQRPQQNTLPVKVKEFALPIAEAADVYDSLRFNPVP
jgi:hypothetical protein